MIGVGLVLKVMGTIVAEDFPQGFFASTDNSKEFL